TASYQLEFGRTEAQPALFCALQSVCTAEDRDPLLRLRRLAVAGWAMSQDWSNDAQNPTRGGVARFELRHAGSGIGSDPGIQFNKLTGDLSLYVALRPSVVLA